jgi:DNA repair protein RadA/Sms
VTSFYCTACNCVQPIWFPQCPACDKWNAITRSPEQAAPPRASTNGSNVGLVLDGSPVDIGVARDDDLEMPEPITSVSREDVDRFITNIPALDHVLGGGLVPGGDVVIGGDPGAGKSTLILQAMAACARWNEARVLYVTGEEDVAQVALRADRVQASYERVYLVAETDPDRILRMAERLDVEIIVVDSISTMCMPDLGAMPGSATQVRACAELLHAWCRDHRVALVQIAHVTKDGAVAGPNTLRHLVDAVLFLEALEGSQLRTLRAHKNRYGSTAKLGRFEMTEAGLASVGNYTDEPHDTPQREPADTDPALVQAESMS